MEKLDAERNLYVSCYKREKGEIPLTIELPGFAPPVA